MHSTYPSVFNVNQNINILSNTRLNNNYNVKQHVNISINIYI
jgi:hypothetical protein